MKIKFLISIILISIFSSLFAQKNLSKDSLIIGMVVDGEWDLNKMILENLEKELRSALSQQTVVSIPQEKILVGDWTLKNISELNDQLLADKDVDMVIGFGVLASYDLARRTVLPKPVIAPVIIDSTVQKVKNSNGTSGVKNLSYLLFPGTFAGDLKMFREIAGFSNVLVLISERYTSAFGDRGNIIQDLESISGINIKRMSVGEDIQSTLNSIPNDIEAVYLDVLPISREKFKQLVQGLTKKKLPTFSFLGEMDVRDGAMAAANSDIFSRLARRIGINIQRILLGEDAGTLSVSFLPAKRPSINLHTAYNVGVSPKWSFMLEADLILQEDNEIKDAANYSLEDVVKNIGSQNLDVLAKIQEIAANQQNISIARSNLYPKIDLTITGLKIDPDRAQAGSQPENKMYAEANFSQVLYSEPVLANLKIQGLLYESKKCELESFKQSTILDGSKLFLNFLRSQKISKIIIENLKLLRINLETAQNRQRVGDSGPEEPLRWEAEVAGLRKTAMEVYSQMVQLQLAMRQMLNIPRTQQINIKDISQDSVTQLISNSKFLRLLEDPLSCEIVTNFMVDLGVKKSFEIQLIKNLIGVKEKSLNSLGLSFYVPTVSAFGTITRSLYKSDVSSPFNVTMPAPPSSMSPDIAAYLGQIFSGFSSPAPKNIEWNIGLNVSLNLFNGMNSSLQKEQSEIEMRQLNLQLKSVEQKITLIIRSEMENIIAKNFGVKQSQIQVEAAKKTLKIVSDSYSRGASSILSLIDAQSSSLNAQQVSANAIYDLYISYMQLQKAISQFDALLTGEERQLFFDSMSNLILKSLRQN